MTTLQQRFEILARERPDITQAALARATNAKPPSVNAWFSGDTKSMKGETAIKAAALYGCNVAWLTTGNGPIWPSEKKAPLPLLEIATTSSEIDDEITIPQFNVSGGMDSNGKLVLEAEQPGLIKSWQVDREWLRLNVPTYSSLQNLCIVTGFGPSMKPMFNPGDPLLMDRGVTRVDHEGVYFFRVGDEGYIKIIQRVPEFDGPGFKLRIISKNPDYAPYDLSPKNPHFQVIGKILTVWKSEKY